MSTITEPEVDLVNIEVDGIAMAVPKNSMIIEATDKAGISIPRFCYHPKLSIAANCRMCLVDVEKAPKPLPACATPVMEGMRVYTKSRRAIDAQHGVMEFLLINHPLDCPICDQGGECELQDLAMGYGRSVSRFSERKRVVKDKNAGALIQTDMTRCIHCTRCVRFLEEVAGTSEMGGTGRGDRLEIGTCIENSIDSELSGNIIDICPVGALTNKPFRFSARAWEMEAKKSVALHDGVGSSLIYHHRRGKIMRAVPAESESTNESWLSDRDRYSHFGLYSADRALTPRVRVDGQWREVSWDEGMQAAADALRGVVDEHGGFELGVLMSPSAFNEEYFLTQKLARGLGCHNIDHRLREQDFSDEETRAGWAVFQASIAEMEKADRFLLIGSNIRHEAPILGHRVRKAWRAGAQIAAINPLDWNFHFDLAHTSVVAPQDMLQAVAGLALAVAQATGAAVPDHLSALTSSAKASDQHQLMAQQLHEGKLGVVVLGQFAMGHPAAARLRGLAAFIANASGSRLNVLAHGGNPAGAWRYGAVPQAESPGLTARSMIDKPRKSYLLWDFEPDLDYANPALADQAMQGAEKIVAITSFASSYLEGIADVILPLAPAAESEGLMTNLDGQLMEVRPAGRLSGECKAGWKILRRLGEELGLDGFDQVGLAEIRAEMKTFAAAPREAGKASKLKSWSPDKGFYRIGEIPMFGFDALCRRSQPLQATTHANSNFAGLNPLDAAKLKVAEGDSINLQQGRAKIEMPVNISDEVPAGAVWLRGATPATNALSENIGPINISAGGGDR